MSKNKVLPHKQAFFPALSLPSKLILAVVICLVAIVTVSLLQKPGRYVTEFVKVDKEYPVGRTEAVTEEEKQVLVTLDEIGQAVQAQPWFAQADEHIFVTVEDLDNLPLTITAANGAYDIKVGWHDPEKRTLDIPLQVFHINRLAEIVEDGEFTESELFELASVGLVPVLESLYQADALYFPGDKRLLKLDNFLQVEVLNTFGLNDQYGNPLQAKATVLNVDGQWLVFPGHQGQPDVNYVVTVQQMLEYYELLQYKFGSVEPGDLLKRKALLDEYFMLREETSLEPSTL